MKKTLAFIGVLSIANLSIAKEVLWKCIDRDTGSVVFSNAPRKGESCKVLSTLLTQEEKLQQFQKNLKPGDVSDKGLVIEVKRPLARVQGTVAERWYRVSDLSPIQDAKSD